MSDEKYNGTEGLDQLLGQSFIQVRQGWEPMLLYGLSFIETQM